MPTHSHLNLTLKINENEKILWYGKPHKKCLFVKAIFNILLLCSIVFGSTAIICFMETVEDYPWSWIFVILGVAVVLTYLYPIISLYLEYENINYVITDKALYMQEGRLQTKHKIYPHEEIKYINNSPKYETFWDNFFHLGNVNIYYANQPKRSFISDCLLLPEGVNIHTISDYKEVYNLLNEIYIKYLNTKQHSSYVNTLNDSITDDPLLNFIIKTKKKIKLWLLNKK